MTAQAARFRALIEAKRAELLKAAESHGAYELRLFGSVARGDADEESDIDILVKMQAGRSLFDLGGLLADFEAILGMKVDVATEKGLKERIRERVLKEAVPL